LEKDSLNLIDWFTSNQMKVNPDKFQAIAIGKNTQSKNISFNLKNRSQNMIMYYRLDNYIENCQI
jgi:hypothetical protein